MAREILVLANMMLQSYALEVYRRCLRVKVSSDHLGRCAYLYIRQSTLRQVLENTESTKRQYALRDRAISLGWLPESIVVIDSDLGQSGTTADREGFQKLVAEVTLGKAGIVMGIEVSRLARSSVEWTRLLEICAFTDTLILDEDGIYDPKTFNDRLLLGLKGTISEAELHVLQARMQGGSLNKARRGELKTKLPIGFLYDDSDRIILDRCPDPMAYGRSSRYSDGQAHVQQCGPFARKACSSAQSEFGLQRRTDGCL